MAYRDFSVKKVKKVFGLTEKPRNLFNELGETEPSDWLKETLEIGYYFWLCHDR